ncbi:MAG: glycine zipper domain-containing protein [Pseudomonadota bacterium]|jgi:hypothetical protein
MERKQNSTIANLSKSGVFIMLTVVAPMLSAQGPYVYPAKGQSAEQMAADKAQCQSWATQQTGFDPLKAAAAPSPTPAAQPGKGGLLRGGAKGAAAGAAIGAVAGDAGKGAAIGAVGGGVLSAAKHRRQQQAEQKAQGQQAQTQASQSSDYLRAYGACLKGRGYSVE